MAIEVGTAWAMAALLLSLRIGPVLVLAPPFTQVRVPMRVRVCLALALAACFAAHASQGMPRLGYDGGAALLACAASELFLGLAIAFAFQAAFASLSFAGRMLDVQAGFGLAMVIDPGSRSQAPLFGTVLTLVAGVIFFAAGGHHELLRLIAASIESMPVGQAQLVGNPQAFIAYFGVIMGLGLSAVAAVTIALFLIDLTIAFLSRTLPQMNALMLGLQVKAIAALVVTSLSAGLLAPVALRLMRMALEFVPALD
ncbi:flagellar biosynthetic protein FliR [Trinickia terrae]|uniref:Flagellar biosynthetic protein FliR n=1 Tax=Trinickia terrae TaxID=2571161 RepID=A0A4V5PKE4_9BURK|nr:flagellar biosynthetic protein FliR [Trinickia terrae]TKC89470.1 flagellar biosynthetic protein FliR [Trinickia terrae]